MMKRILPYTLSLCLSLCGNVPAICQEPREDPPLSPDMITGEGYDEDFDDEEYAGEFYEGSPEEDYLNSDIRNRPFDKKQWEGLVGDLDYSQKTKKRPENKKKKAAAPEEPDNPRPPLKFNAGWLKYVAQGILIVGGAVLLAFIIYRMLGFKGGPSNKRINRQSDIGEINLEKIEENLAETDLERYIRLAVEQGNLPLAVRLYYLAVIQSLSQRQVIRWKKDKTNRHYLAEAAATGFYPEFRALTLVYETTWYGNLDLDREMFDQLQSRFNTFIRDIRQPLTPAPAS